MVRTEKSPRLTLTAKDLQLAEAIVRFGNIKDAANSLDLNLQTVYNRGRTIRRQVKEARDFNNRVLTQCRRDARLKSFWWPKRHIPDTEAKDDE